MAMARLMQRSTTVTQISKTEKMLRQGRPPERARLPKRGARRRRNDAELKMGGPALPTTAGPFSFASVPVFAPKCPQLRGAGRVAHPSRVARAIRELGKHPRRLARLLVSLFCFLQLRRNLALQPGVASQAKHIVHLVLLAPAHQLFPAETRIGTQDDAHLGPAVANLLHDPLHLFPATRAGILVRGTLPRTQQVIAAERQVAVLV